MTKNPFINALAASLYITVIGLVMGYGSEFAPKKFSILAPIAMISLFTLSAAVMGYLFCFRPIEMYFDNKKKEAVGLFLRTVMIFGIITVVLFGILFSGIIR